MVDDDQRKNALSLRKVTELNDDRYNGPVMRTGRGPTENRLAAKRSPSVSRVLAASILVLILVVGFITADSAGAIGKTSCTSTTDWYKSTSHTTCWSGYGDINSYTYNTYGHHSGQWQGCYNWTFTAGASGSGTNVFVPFVNFNFSSGVRERIEYISHQSGTPSEVPCIV